MSGRRKPRMLATSRPLLPPRSRTADAHLPHVLDAAPLLRSVSESFPFSGALAALLLGFLCFMPYPGLPVGNSTGIQTGNLISLAVALPCLLMPWKGRPLVVVVALLAPLALSILKVALTDSSQLDLCFKSLMVTGLAGLSLIAGQRIAPRYGLALLTGIAVATLIHVA